MGISTILISQISTLQFKFIFGYKFLFNKILDNIDQFVSVILDKLGVEHVHD